MSAESLHQAIPRAPHEIASLPRCPEVLAAAKRVGITSVVHFTTFSGCVGVLASGALKSRSRLPHDSYLEHVYRPNTDFRKDQQWLDYVSLSIERINDWMFDSSRKWHAADKNPWVVLSFLPRILAHPGVVFTTTNNIYPSCLRFEGLAGFQRMFADSVVGRYGQAHSRSDKQLGWPTDRQAEVLYPGELSCKHLQRIYVQSEDAVDQIRGSLAGLQLDVGVSYAPEVFQ